MYQDSDEQLSLLPEIERRDAEPNKLQLEIEANEGEMVRKRICWEKITSEEFEDFPKLTLEELHRISMGKFNVKSARGYTDAHFETDHHYQVSVHKQRPGLLRIKLGSKFRGSSTHMVWIEYTSQEDGGKITGHYCQCMQGARSITTCGHITSVLWFLCYERHRQPTYKPRSFGNDILDLAVKKVQQQQVLALPDSSELDQFDD